MFAGCRPVLGRGELGSRRDAQLGCLALGLLIVEKAAIRDEQFLAVPAAVKPVEGGIGIIRAAPNHGKAQIVRIVAAALVFERDGADVGRQQKPDHGVLALPGRDDLARKVPKEKRQDAQRGGLADPIGAEDGSTTARIDLGDAVARYVQVGADVHQDHPTQLVLESVVRHGPRFQMALLHSCICTPDGIRIMCLTSP